MSVTGVVVDANGYILTNSHVVSDGKAIRLMYYLMMVQRQKVKFIGMTAQLDLAIVKVEKTGLTPAEFGDSDNVTTRRYIYSNR